MAVAVFHCGGKHTGAFWRRRATSSELETSDVFLSNWCWNFHPPSAAVGGAVTPGAFVNPARRSGPAFRPRFSPCPVPPVRPGLSKSGLRVLCSSAMSEKSMVA